MNGWNSMNKSIRFAGLAVMVGMAMLIAAPARGAIVNRAVLKSFFQKGAKPTAEQFSTLIDSTVNLTDDGLTLVGIGTDLSQGDIRAARKITNDAIDGSLTYADPSTDPVLEPDWAGASGFLPLEYQDSTGQAHFGFLQMSMDAETVPPSADGPAIHVDYWAWETTANAAVIAAPVPEPVEMACMMGMAFLGTGRRCKRMPS
jgi:hypothetical protein